LPPDDVTGKYSFTKKALHTHTHTHTR